MVLAILLALLTLITACSRHDAGHSAYKSKDMLGAFQAWEECSKSGDAECQFDLGMMYLNGEGRPVDVKTGIDWLSRSAGKGYTSAQNRLGILYLNGKVVTRDYARAMEYFMAAATRGFPAGQANVGLIYWRGYGVPVDLSEAFAWSEASTQKLASGAKQRDEIVKQMSGEQWAKGRDRALQLKKLYQPPSNFPWMLAIEIASTGVTFIIAILMLWGLIKTKLMPRFTS